VYAVAAAAASVRGLESCLDEALEIALDVVELSPPYDHAEITAFLANRVCLEARDTA
jgi:arginase family enzyme